ncbi:gluconate transporter [Carboxylicivirga marina]|uniref:Gluconate transporter n=1 Tax=Carboxylicivirga marina TaxID=2800988 RepID=A0ABS1HQS8_9BACT|nr:gluconate transporter [Carboxylicivirga marina]MBK3519583.1 gluconate transporter [Carboxylicivirga marina]
MSDISLVITALGSILLLLILVMKVRMHAIVALIVVSIIAGLLSGMSPASIAQTIEKGMGGTLGFIAVVVALGAMFGKVMEETGALDRIAETLLARFGIKRANWAMAITGLICSMPLFFDVAVVLLIGLVHAVVRRGGGSMIKIGIALFAGIASCQAFLLPAPGPVLVASLLGADFGYVIFFGVLAAIPAMILAGPLFGSFIAKKVHVELPEYHRTEKEESVQKKGPSFGMALLMISLPLLLIGLKTVFSRFVPESSSSHQWLQFFGHPFIAITIACLVSFYFLAIPQGLSRNKVMQICSEALVPAGIIILVTGAGGVFKQILIDSGVGQALGDMLSDSGMPIVVLAFILSAAVRIIQGSATVAMLTSCGLIAPMLEGVNYSDIQLAAITIAIGAGSIVLSHVNDSGFWLANKYLVLTEKQTLQTWTVMETIIGVTGGVVASLIMLFL